MAVSALPLRQRAEQLAATLPPLMVDAERVASTVAQGVHGRRLPAASGKPAVT